MVLVRKGGEQQAFKHVTEAVAAPRDGDTIEVHGNGPFLMAPVVR